MIHLFLEHVQIFTVDPTYKTKLDHTKLMLMVFQRSKGAILAIIFCQQ